MRTNDANRRRPTAHDCRRGREDRILPHGGKRASYDKPATGLGCLGGSSAVEYCSDSVAFLGIDGNGTERRTNMSQPIRPLKLTMLKNRYGTCGEATLLYDAEHATFSEAS